MILLTIPHFPQASTYHFRTLSRGFWALYWISFHPQSRGLWEIQLVQLLRIETRLSKCCVDAYAVNMNMESYPAPSSLGEATHWCNFTFTESRQICSSLPYLYAIREDLAWALTTAASFIHSFVYHRLCDKTSVLAILSLEESGGLIDQVRLGLSACLSWEFCIACRIKTYSLDLIVLVQEISDRTPEGLWTCTIRFGKARDLKAPQFLAHCNNL